MNDIYHIIPSPFARIIVRDVSTVGVWDWNVTAIGRFEGCSRMTSSLAPAIQTYNLRFQNDTDSCTEWTDKLPLPATAAGRKLEVSQHPSRKELIPYTLDRWYLSCCVIFPLSNLIWSITSLKHPWSNMNQKQCLQHDWFSTWFARLCVWRKSFRFNSHWTLKSKYYSVKNLWLVGR